MGLFFINFDLTELKLFSVFSVLSSSFMFLHVYTISWETGACAEIFCRGAVEGAFRIKV